MHPLLQPHARTFVMVWQGYIIRPMTL